MASSDLTKIQRVMLRLPKGLVRYMDSKVAKQKAETGTGNRNAWVAQLLKRELAAEAAGGSKP